VRVEVTDGVTETGWTAVSICSLEVGILVDARQQADRDLVGIVLWLGKGVVNTDVGQ